MSVRLTVDTGTLTTGTISVALVGITDVHYHGGFTDVHYHEGFTDVHYHEGITDVHYHEGITDVHYKSSVLFSTSWKYLHLKDACQEHQAKSTFYLTQSLLHASTT